MSPTDTFARAFDAMPAHLQSGSRKLALARLLQSGLPRRHGEHWKYTDLSSLEDAEISTEIDAGASDPQLPEDADGIEALNAAFASGGLDVSLDSTESAPDLLVAGGKHHRRHRVRVRSQVEARIEMQLEADSSFQSVVLDLHLEPGAHVQLLRTQDAATSARHFSRIRAFLDRDARLDIATVDFGGRLSRHDLDVRLEGPGASVSLSGLFQADNKAHIDNHVRFDHLAPHCQSLQSIRGLAGDQSRGIFTGKVMVHPDAQKTESEQRLANLLLSPRAEINAKPELEIHADDVKCAHGATFGQLDALALFYLRARGLPEPEARAMLTLAFALEPLKAIADEQFREQALALAFKRIGAGLEGLPQ